jgi:tetratricopeptide (TPR) repeat protein
MSDCCKNHFKEINITYDGIETKWTKMTPRVLRRRVEQIYEYLPTDPQRAINEILTIYLKHKELPVLNSYLCQAYGAIGDLDKAEKMIAKNYKSFPRYLFAKTNYAHLCLSRGNIEQINEIFEWKSDLQSLYPRRKVFHYTEYLAFMSVWAVYYDKIHKREMAKTCYNSMKSVDSEHYYTRTTKRLIHHSLLLRILKKLFGKKRFEEKENP